MRSYSICLLSSASTIIAVALMLAVHRWNVVDAETRFTRLVDVAKREVVKHIEDLKESQPLYMLPDDRFELHMKASIREQKQDSLKQ